MGRILGVACVVFLTSCGTEGPPTGRVVRGSVVDADTGAPVACEHLTVEALDAVTGRGPAARVGPDARFVVAASAAVRLVVRDASDAFAPYEAALDVPEAGADHRVRLRPTNYVLLRGRVLWRDGAVADVPIAIGDGLRPVARRPDGTYEVRLPPTRHAVRALDGRCRLLTREIDLGLIATDAWNANIYLAKD
jgi:hypothetical protein